jgi:hypothetical protein
VFNPRDKRKAFNVACDCIASADIGVKFFREHGSIPFLARLPRGFVQP